MKQGRLWIYSLFFASGASGLVYEVIWVRQFGLLFGSTIYSAALVTSIYMSGLGLGSYLAGRWVDGRYREDPTVPVRAYGCFEFGIAGGALLILLSTPYLAELAASASSYVEAENGWNRLSAAGSAVRYGCAVALLGPVTLLMGGTLTLLIRHLVGDDLGSAGWHVGALYGVNTAGAALGCLLTDIALVPLLGLVGTQLLAVGLNLFAGTGALLLAQRARRAGPAPPAQEASSKRGLDARVAWAGVAIALSGFAAMMMQILWFRHLISLYGAYRPVFSILLTVILVGIWLGSLLGGELARRTRRPGTVYAMALVGFVLWALAALVLVEKGEGFLPFYAYLLRETTLVVGPPALLMGTAFPLANALVQRVRAEVGERAGILYLANTVGGVLGSLLAGFLLLPTLGIQGTAMVVVGCVSVAMLAIGMAARGVEPPARGVLGLGLATVLVIGVCWAWLPEHTLLMRSLPEKIRRGEEQVLAIREGVNETIAVSELDGTFMRLFTNGHNMSTTNFIAQRYMRAFVHVPMLIGDGIENVMIMCYGVGNTANAALLYPSVKHVDVVDISLDVLEYARFFAPVNGEPLADPRVQVHVNDARQHLRMIGEERYDLITGEPPPIAQAGVANLYTREFFELAESRLRPGGFISYWLPMDQVGEDVARVMVRAFLEVFPQSALLSGFRHQLILIGRKGVPLEVDPERIRRRIDAVPGLRRELRWISLDHPVEVVGLLAATAETMERATSGRPPLRDDHPVLEYGSRAFSSDRKLPADLFSLADVVRWCPRCFDGGLEPAELAELRGYLQVVAAYYESTAFLYHQVGQDLRFQVDLTKVGRLATHHSPYLQHLQGILPAGFMTAERQLRHGKVEAAVETLRQLVSESPRYVTAKVDLADLYLELGRPELARQLLEEARAQAPQNRRVLASWERLRKSTNGDSWPDEPPRE